MTKNLYTTMLSMRTRIAFPRDWRRVDGDKLQRIIAELAAAAPSPTAPPAVSLRAAA